MIHAVVMGCVLAGVSVFGTVDPGGISEKTRNELQKRGLEATSENVYLLADEAFAKEDNALFMALFQNFVEYWEVRDRLADRILTLYKDHADTTFKKDISVYVACELSGIERIVQSKYGCELYNVTINTLFATTPQERRAYAEIAIGNFSKNADLLLFPYLVKMLLVQTNSVNDMITISSAFKVIEKNFSSVTPEMACHVYKRYQSEYSFQRYKKAYEGKAKALLNTPSLPESASQANVIKQLDEMTNEEGRKYIEKYKDVEQKPYSPPQPRDPKKWIKVPGAGDLYERLPDGYEVTPDGSIKIIETTDQNKNQ